MFVLVVVFINGPHHLLLAIINRHDGQIIEWCFIRSAPKDITLLFQLPVAERDDDMSKLQTFRLVDGYQAYTVNFVTLNGLGK